MSAYQISFEILIPKYIGNNTIYHKYIELFNAVAVTNMSIFVVHDHVDGKFDLDRKGVPGSTVKK